MNNPILFFAIPQTRAATINPIIKAIIRTLTGRLNDMNEKTEKIWKELHFLSSPDDPQD